MTPFLLFFQIYDYAQYYLDLADANRKVAEATLNEANGLDPANRYIMKKFCMRIITDRNIKCQVFTHMADSRYKMQKIDKLFENGMSEILDNSFINSLRSISDRNQSRKKICYNILYS